MRALILAGGPVEASERLVALAQAADLVIAADGGLRHAAALGVRPARLVGDFDSVHPDDLATWPEVPRERHPTDKDDLDLELALDAAAGDGADDVRVAGALGGRNDQSLAAVFIALRWRRRGVRISLDTGAEEIRALIAGDAADVDAPDGTLFSLLPIAAGTVATVVSVSGARYPLDHDVLAVGFGRGLSNQVSGSDGARIDVHDGAVALWIGWGVPVRPIHEPEGRPG